MELQAAKKEIKDIVESANDYQDSINSIEKKLMSLATDVKNVYTAIPKATNMDVIVTPSKNDAKTQTTLIKEILSSTKSSLKTLNANATAQIKAIVDDYNHSIQTANTNKEYSDANSYNVPIQTEFLSAPAVNLASAASSIPDYTVDLGDLSGSSNSMIVFKAEEADKIAVEMNYMVTDGKSILTSSNSINTNKLDNYSPVTTLSTEQIKENIKDLADKLSKSYDNYKGSLDIIYEGLDETKSLVENLNTGTGYEDANFMKLIDDALEAGIFVIEEHDGEEWYVVNSAINHSDLEKWIENQQLAQFYGFRDNGCSEISQMYGDIMMRGYKYSKMHMTEQSPSGKLNKNVESEDKEVILKYVFSEALNGRLSSIQVTQQNSDKGDRHFVTFIGFSTKVKSINDLNADTMYVIDPYSGKSTALSKCCNDGFKRDLYAHGGKYLARGANDDYAMQVSDKRKASTAYRMHFISKG